MPAQTPTPIVVGIGDVKNQSAKLEDGLEPMELMLQAIHKALNDAALPRSATAKLQSDIDSLDVVASWTWPYEDLPGLLAENLGVTPKHKYVPGYNSGSQPGRLFDDAARRISKRQSTVAVITGGEALASLAAFSAQGKIPPPGWTKPNDNVESVFAKAAREAEGTLGAIHSILKPLQIYPLFENGFRAHRGQSITENERESGMLYAEFAKVAERNPLAWNYGKTAPSAESIRTVTKKNRMISFPYPLLMNAFNTVNLASACILTSTEYARELGIPESKWIYPLGGAGTKDSSTFWTRPNFYTSPAISKVLDSGLTISGLKKDQIDLYDFYSKVFPINHALCFPIVPKLACHHLGLPIIGSTKPITLLGGLTSFGGAGNNYSMHAITEMVRELRKGNGRNGLVLANGGVMTNQHAVCISVAPRADGSPYPERNPLPETLEPYESYDGPPEVEVAPGGEATVETYTVDFERDGTPGLGHVVGRLRSSGKRFLANHADDATLEQLASGVMEPIGRVGWVWRDEEEEGRNLFSFRRPGGKL